MKELVGEDHIVGLKRRLVRKLLKVEKTPQYPTGLKFSVQYLYRWDESWKEIIRIDNYMHENRAGPHIHYFGKERVQWVEISFNDASEEVLRLGEKIIKELEGDNYGKD